MTAVTQVAKGVVVGLAFVQAWLVGSDGYMYGNTGEGAAATTVTHATLLKFCLDAQLPSPKRVIAQMKGGNRWLGQVAFGINEVGDFPITAQDIDSAFWALATQSAVDTATNTRWRRMSNNLNLQNLPQMGLMLTTIYQSRDDDSDGINLYINYIIPRAQVQPNFPKMAYQAAGEGQYIVSPTMATKEPNGRLFSAGGMSLADNRCPMYAIVTPKPLALSLYVGNGVLTTFKSLYLPSSSIITLNSAANEFALNGTLAALTSSNTGTGVHTKAGAGSSGDLGELMYETDFVLSP